MSSRPEPTGSYLQLSLARLLLGCTLCLFMGAVHANSDIALSAASPSVMPLVQGEDGEFVVRVTNKGPDPLPLVTVATPVSSIYLGWYPMSMPVQAGCAGLFPGFPFHPSGFISGFHFTVGPLAAGQHQDCRFTVHRAVTTINDGAYGWQTEEENDPQPSNNAVAFIMGSFTDVGIRTETVGFAVGADGFADGLVRLTAKNNGPTAVREFQVGMCTDTILPDFSIDGDIAQGCGGTQFGPVCFDNGFGFLRPQLEVGESHSCLIRLRSRTPYTEPLSFPLLLQTFTLVRSDLGALIDLDAGNDYAEMVLGPVPTVSVETMNPIGRWCLIVLLLAMAGRMLSRR